MNGRRFAIVLAFSLLLADFAAEIAAAQTRELRWQPGTHLILGPSGSPRPTVTPNSERLTYRVGSDATVDLGWTGISHGQTWPSGQAITFEMRCSSRGEPCDVRSGRRGDLFGPPVPLSSGGVPVCLMNRLRVPVAGRLDASGCGTLVLALDTTVIMAQDVARPCPVCGGDGKPRDGRKDGHCEGGEKDGAPCDVEGDSVLFGSTSSDCTPSGSPVGTLPIEIGPLTTESFEWQADQPCGDGRSPTKCFCAGQAQANACSNGSCALSKCGKGPFDGYCSRAPFRSCKAAGTADCDDKFPGAGKCAIRPRPCFGERITERGVCDKTRPVFAGKFCVAATSAPALNTTAGLPGPARLRLPLERVDAARSPAADVKPASKPAKRRR